MNTPHATTDGFVAGQIRRALEESGRSAYDIGHEIDPQARVPQAWISEILSGARPRNLHDPRFLATLRRLAKATQKPLVFFLPPPPIPQTFRQAVRVARLHRGFSQQQLAAAVPTHRSTINKIEGDPTFHYSPQLAAAIARVLGLPMASSTPGQARACPTCQTRHSGLWCPHCGTRVE